MGQRKTRLSGIAKPRIEDTGLRRSLDAIIERLEVLDGIRGDNLDKAVTWRELDESGFVLSQTYGGGWSVTTTPPSTGGGAGGGPVVGPAAAPTNLTAADIFLAILLSWDNPSFNLQHVEVHRADVDNLSLAVMIGTTSAGKFIDYVGGGASYY